MAHRRMVPNARTRQQVVDAVFEALSHTDHALAYIPAPGRPDVPLPELCADVVIAAGWRPTLRSRIRRLVESVRVMVDAGVQGWDEGDDPRGRQR